jgi:2-aminoadipate transaminase
MNPSVIREILKVTERPGIISWPAACRRRRPFRWTRCARPAPKVLQPTTAQALQYAASEGFAPAARDGWPRN